MYIMRREQFFFILMYARLYCILSAFHVVNEFLLSLVFGAFRTFFSLK